jgi:hypothetical protein
VVAQALYDPSAHRGQGASTSREIVA